MGPPLIRTLLIPWSLDLYIINYTKLWLWNIEIQEIIFGLRVSSLLVLVEEMDDGIFWVRFEPPFLCFPVSVCAYDVSYGFYASYCTPHPSLSLPLFTMIPTIPIITMDCFNRLFRQFLLT